MQQSRYQPFPPGAGHRATHSVGPRRSGPMGSGGAHHAAPLTQQQVEQQRQQAAMQVEMAKRRSKKPTDKNLPEGIDECSIGDIAARYKDMRDFERKLDAIMTRKRLDIVDSVNRSAKTWKTLRIWITNTVEDQVWQGNPMSVDTFDFKAEVDPTYRVKIEGRLLDDESDLEGQSADEKDEDRMDEDGDEAAESEPAKPPKQLFSHLFRSLTVEFPAHRKGIDPIVEWKKPERPGHPSSLFNGSEFDVFSFKRSSDENMNITINLVRHEEPERYAVSPELADVIDRPEATRQQILLAVWDYIKEMGLQEDEEMRNFRCDDLLRKAFRTESGFIPKLHEYVSPHLRPLPPVRLEYTVRVDEEFNRNPHATIYDVRVLVDDPVREKMAAFLNNPGFASMLKEVAALDEQLATLVQATHVSKAKHDFLTSLSLDPATFVVDWLSSQKRDLDVIMGESRRSGRDETSGDEWRKGGKDSVWNTMNAKESVSVLLAKQPAHVQRP